MWCVPVSVVSEPTLHSRGVATLVVMFWFPRCRVDIVVLFLDLTGLAAMLAVAELAVGVSIFRVRVAELVG